MDPDSEEDEVGSKKNPHLQIRAQEDSCNADTGPSVLLSVADERHLSNSQEAYKQEGMYSERKLDVCLGARTEGFESSCSAVAPVRSDGESDVAKVTTTLTEETECPAQLQAEPGELSTGQTRSTDLTMIILYDQYQLTMHCPYC